MMNTKIVWMALMIASSALAQAGNAQTSDGKKSSGVDGALDTVGNVAKSPLKTMNVIKKELDPALEAMMKEPYSLNGVRNCGDYIAEVRKIDGLVGPDVDSAEAKAAASKKQTPGEFTAGAAEAVAAGMVPMSGMVRVVSGAAKREKYVAAAVFSGSLRRAYLKGRARELGCKI
jgi:hypothetical protein